MIRPETGVGTNGITTNTSRPSVAQSVEKMGSPHPIFSEVIPEAKRPSREEMIKTANHYFTGLQRNDGKGYYPFTNDCDRYENGNKSTNVPMRNPINGKTEVYGCKKQFEEALKGVVSRVRDRRFVAVDRERGIVFAFGFFGKIRRIEAVFHHAPMESTPDGAPTSRESRTSPRSFADA
ncbi:MAG TPA: hypothetical protein VGM84_27300 [Steroidobacteraceae bacterium]